MLKFDTICYYPDTEVNGALQNIAHHPMMKSLMEFTFPDLEESVWKEQLKGVHSIKDFQERFVYHSIKKIINTSSGGLTDSGFEKLDKDKSYLFISNHRDIMLDTSLLNVVLKEHGLIMTASAIGDNLVTKPFLLELSKLNRNFLVKRGLPPRELLKSSKLMSEYIYYLLTNDKRSVWIAQGEGRTKDGNDTTQQGVLKMLAMASNEAELMDYFKEINIVPISISYEYDPTDALKVPALIAKNNQEVYVKDKNEDFINLLTGLTGQKKRIHIHAGKVLDSELDEIKEETTNNKKQIQAVSQVIDESILSSYKLWPTNYIAYDILNNTNRFSTYYSEEEKQIFQRRLKLRVDNQNKEIVDGFLTMYANPVINKMKLQNA